jgi:hypothetical protein
MCEALIPPHDITGCETSRLKMNVSCRNTRSARQPVHVISICSKCTHSTNYVIQSTGDITMKMSTTTLAFSHPKFLPDINFPERFIWKTRTYCMASVIF